MKRIYIKPRVKMIGMDVIVMSTGSIINLNKVIRYGGVDEDGTFDPASRQCNDVWDDEEEDEEMSEF